MHKKLWATIAILVLIIAVMTYKFIFFGNAKMGADGRMEVPLNSVERNILLSEMRLYMETIQQVTESMGNNTLPQSAPALKRVGNVARNSLPGPLMAKFPSPFRQLNSDTHEKFESLAASATSGDQPESMKRLGELLRVCVACHAAFKIEITK